MLRNISMLVIVAVLVLGVSDAFAECKHIEGHSFGDIFPSAACGSDLPFGGCLSGTAKGGLKGDFDVIFDFVAVNPALPEVVYATGQTVLVNKNGDKLYGTDSSATNSVTGDSADLITWTGGTGEFAGASGQVVLDAILDFVNMTFETRFRGELCTP